MILAPATVQNICKCQKEDVQEEKLGIIVSAHVDVQM